MESVHSDRERKLESLFEDGGKLPSDERCKKRKL